MEKTIKLFLGSPLNVLEKDKKILMSFVQILNVTLQEYQLLISFIETDKSFFALDGVLKKEVMRQTLDDCKLAIFILDLNWDNLSDQEFNVVFETLKTRKDSRIVILFKEPNVELLTDSLKCFKEQIDEEINHYYSTYQDENQLKLRLLIEIARIVPDLNLRLEQGTCYLQDQKIDQLDITELPIYKNHHELSQLRNHLKEFETLMNRPITNKENIHQIRAKITLLKKDILLIEHFILEVLIRLYNQAAKNNMTPLMKHARLFIEQGEIDKARLILSRDAVIEQSMKTESHSKKNMVEFQHQIFAEIETLILAALVHVQIRESESNQDAIEMFEKACEFTQLYRLPLMVFSPYVSFLLSYHIDSAVRVLNRYQNAIEMDELGDVEKAYHYKQLASLYVSIDYKKAIDTYLKSLNFYQVLYQNNQNEVMLPLVNTITELLNALLASIEPEIQKDDYDVLLTVISTVNEAIQMLIKQNDSVFLYPVVRTFGSLNFSIGHMLIQKREFETASFFLKDALHAFSKVVAHDNSVQTDLLNCYFDLYTCYIGLSQTKNSVEIALNALKKIDQFDFNQVDVLETLYTFLIHAHKELLKPSHLFDDSVDYFQFFVNHFKLQNKDDSPHIFIHLIHAMSRLSDTFVRLGKYPESLSMTKQAYELLMLHSSLTVSDRYVFMFEESVFQLIENYHQYMLKYEDITDKETFLNHIYSLKTVLYKLNTSHKEDLIKSIEQLIAFYQKTRQKNKELPMQTLLNELFKNQRGTLNDINNKKEERSSLNMHVESIDIADVKTGEVKKMESIEPIYSNPKDVIKLSQELMDLPVSPVKKIEKHEIKAKSWYDEAKQHFPNESKKAIRLIKKSLSYYKDLNDINKLAYDMHVSTCLISLNDCYVVLLKFKKGIAILQKAMKPFKGVKPKQADRYEYLTIIHQKIGRSYLLMNKPKKAKPYLEDVFESFIKLYGSDKKRFKDILETSYVELRTLYLSLKVKDRILDDLDKRMTKTI
jgi:tetratricopeptide (TPR) repeat protein